MIPLVAPCITDQDLEYMTDAVLDGMLQSEWHVAAFEKLFALRVGCEWAVAVNSGTSALIVALRAVWPMLRDVRIPSWACRSIRNAVVAESGAAPRYADTDWDVRRAKADCMADVVVHMFGNPTFHGNTATIADHTLSLGATNHHGKLGVCSTNADKMLSTGRGGVIFGNEEGLRGRIQELVHYEQHIGFGFSVAMSSTQAALGVSQLCQLDKFIERRRELAHRYTDAFRPAGIECPDADCGSVFFRYLIAVDDPAAKVEQLAERGIEAGRGVYPPLHQLAGLPDDDFPGTTAAVNSLLSVPVHPSITDAQAEHIVESVKMVCAP